MSNKPMDELRGSCKVLCRPSWYGCIYLRCTRVAGSTKDGIVCGKEATDDPR